MMNNDTEIKVWDKGVARWVITTPSGEIVYVDSLRKYCNQHDINYQMLLRKHRTQIYVYKDYIIRKNTKSD